MPAAHPRAKIYPIAGALAPAAVWRSVYRAIPVFTLCTSIPASQNRSWSPASVNVIRDCTSKLRNGWPPGSQKPGCDQTIWQERRGTIQLIRSLQQCSQQRMKTMFFKTMGRQIVTIILFAFSLAGCESIQIDQTMTVTPIIPEAAPTLPTSTLIPINALSHPRLFPLYLHMLFRIRSILRRITCFICMARSSKTRGSRRLVPITVNMNTKQS